MLCLKIHQTHHLIGDFDSIFQDLKKELESAQEGEVHLYPELYTCGYPLQDLCLQKSFFSAYLRFLNEFSQWAAQLKAQESLFLFGGLRYQFDDDGLPCSLENGIYSLRPGRELQFCYTKQLLPNYDIFDERKYFKPGDRPGVIDFCGKKIGLLVCEDMWISNQYPQDPVSELAQSCADLDLVVNLSASPYHLGKNHLRVNRAQEISQFLGVPFAYINRIGGEDEILFDGHSFVVSGNSVIAMAKSFEVDTLSCQLPDKFSAQTSQALSKNTWEGLYGAQIDFDQSPPTLKNLRDEDFEELITALSFGLQEYAQKCGFHRFSVALSGGIDSALVLTLISLSLQEGQSLEAIYMPSKFSATQSLTLSEQLCRNLNIPLKIFPIKFLHSVAQNSFQDCLGTALEGLADENIQSRLRGLILYTRSNQLNSMVINTSNKSELSVGYSTQYGDSVGALSLLGDLYKTHIFELCRYINRSRGEIIPEEIILREPTAELRDNQADSQSLPPYERLDAMLELILSNRAQHCDLVNFGFPSEEASLAFNLLGKAEFKRYQFCPIIKLRPKSYGFGHRVPICKYQWH